MAAEILTVRDAVIGAIRTYWQALDPPMGAGDSVVAAYLPDDPEEPQQGTARPVGRKVMVAVESSAHHGMYDRERDNDDHTVYVFVEEWFDGAGQPDAAWLDARVVFTNGLWKTLRNARTPDASLVPDCWPSAAPAVDWYDPPMLRENRAFFAAFPVTYATIADPAP